MLRFRYIGLGNVSAARMCLSGLPAAARALRSTEYSTVSRIAARSLARYKLYMYSKMGTSDFHGYVQMYICMSVS